MYGRLYGTTEGRNVVLNPVPSQHEPGAYWSQMRNLEEYVSVLNMIDSVTSYNSYYTTRHMLIQYYTQSYTTSWHSLHNT